VKRPAAPPAFLALALALALAFALGAALGAAHVAHAAPSDGPRVLKRSPLIGAPGGPTLAAEDTIPVPSALMPTFFVNAPRVTLDEILRRVALGEARRDSLMRDQSYTLTALVTYLDADGKAPRDAKHRFEYASRVYKKQPDKLREVPLIQRSNRKKGDDDWEVTAGPSMREEVVSFAFEPKMRAQYEFAIEERRFIGGHVVYVIGYTPRSKLDPLPTGRVWVDTNDFVIVREEFWYRDHSPEPLFIKRLDSCVIERSLVDGRWWVVTRALARIQLSSAVQVLSKLARDPVTPTVDFVLTRSDWKVNQGIDDAVFTAGAK
jgi:hypothetical protein